MVVFTNGEKDSAAYRRFKMKKDYLGKPNDFAMMQETLRRRLRYLRHDGPRNPRERLSVRRNNERERVRCDGKP